MRGKEEKKGRRKAEKKGEKNGGTNRKKKKKSVRIFFLCSVVIFGTNLGQSKLYLVFMQNIIDEQIMLTSF